MNTVNLLRDLRWEGRKPQTKMRGQKTPKSSCQIPAGNCGENISSDGAPDCLFPTRQTSRGAKRGYWVILLWQACCTFWRNVKSFPKQNLYRMILSWQENYPGSVLSTSEGRGWSWENTCCRYTKMGDGWLPMARKLSWVGQGKPRGRGWGLCTIIPCLQGRRGSPSSYDGEDPNDLWRILVIQDENGRWAWSKSFQSPHGAGK